jgi:hypothetical protein
VIAFVAGHVRDPLQQLGVMLQRAHMVPGDFVGAVAEVVVAERLESSKHRVDLGLPGDKGTRASSFDLLIFFAVRAFIFGLRIVNFAEPMNASFARIIKQNVDRNQELRT